MAYTISSTPLNKVQYLAEEAQPSLVFTSTAIVAIGAAVKLNSDGTVTPVAAHTDKVLGIVTSGCNAANGRVTVQLKFSAVVRGKADGTVAVGAIVDASGYDATAQLTKYKATQASGNTFGIALVGGADTTDIQVCVL